MASFGIVLAALTHPLKAASVSPNAGAVSFAFRRKQWLPPVKLTASNALLRNVHGKQEHGLCPDVPLDRRARQDARAKSATD